MKTYLTAEKFEEEVAKLQAKSDKTINRVNDYLTRKTKELYDQMNEDQQKRAHMRFKARLAAQQRRIIHPGSMRVN